MLQASRLVPSPTPTGEKMKDLLDLLFGNINAAHTQHLATTSLSEHEALGEFYTAARDRLDKFAETLIAMDVVDIDTLDAGAEKMLGVLRAGYVSLQGMRGLCDGDATAENALDELGSVYMDAIFKLSRLK